MIAPKLRRALPRLALAGALAASAGAAHAQQSSPPPDGAAAPGIVERGRTLGGAGGGVGAGVGGGGETGPGARIPGRDRFRATARVIDSRPVFADVTIREPRVECTAGRPAVRVHEARSPRREPGVRGATIVGSLVGGAVGHRLTRDGSDGTRAAGTVAGALLGAGAAREIVRAHDRYGRRFGPRHGRGFEPYGYGHGRGYGRERCVRSVEVREERRLVHHDVTYLFRGRTFRARRAADPGDTIDIDVSLPPSER